ncbi:MAG TPA: hypothetical protein VJP79_10855 [Nitrososphaera sp.]|nr:hypothetical protein [Nitrososphaera sp.]
MTSRLPADEDVMLYLNFFDVITNKSFEDTDVTYDIEIADTDGGNILEKSNQTARQGTDANSFFQAPCC